MKQLGRILLGVDFSDASQSARNEAASLARVFGAEVVLLHALPDLSPRDPEAARVASHVERMLEKVALDLEADDIRVVRPFLLPVGKTPAEALLSAVVEVRPDVVVLGSSTKTAVDRLLLGATAERVVRESLRPVWLTRPLKDREQVKRIVCAIDGSAPAREALGTAAFLARTFVAGLHTLAVLPPGAPEGQEAELRAALDRVDLHGIEHVSHVRHGAPAATIVGAVAELEADLLVIGSARRRGLARLVHGNTAEKLLRQVACSVLTVPLES